MTAVLLGLEMTSNARTPSYDASGAGTPDYVLVDDNGRARLARGDAPHLTYAALWDAACGDYDRGQVIEQAESTLEHILHSHADRNTIEPKDARDRRIIKDGAGFPAAVVAIAFRCGVADIWRARQAADCDVAFGEVAYAGVALSLPERNAEVLRLTNKGLSTREVATRLHIGHKSVRCALARAR